METTRASKVALGHIVCSILLLIIFVITIGVHINTEGVRTNIEEVSDSQSEVVPLQYKSKLLITDIISIEENEVNLAGPKKEVIFNKSYLQDYITKYESELKFFSKVFSVSYKGILEDLNKIHKDNLEFDETNIGLLKKNNNLLTFDTPEHGIVEYFYNYVKRNPNKVNNKRVPYQGSAKYIENLIIYFTTHVYTNVDTKVSLSIGASESGYYKVKGMLKANNVYGGMNKGKLKKYRNIEYGVLSYIRLLSKGYYGKGLNTISKIGFVYCPIRDKNGNKITNPHWLSLVNTAMKKYKDYNLNIEISDLYIDEIL